jgi:hypothetical protein
VQLGWNARDSLTTCKGHRRNEPPSVSLIDGSRPGDVELVDVPVAELEGVGVPVVEVSEGVGVPVVDVSDGDGDAEVVDGVGEISLPVGASVLVIDSSGTEIFSFAAPGTFCFVTATSKIAFLGPPATHSPRTTQA